MPQPSTFTTVPKAVAEDIKTQGSSRKAWLLAIKQGEVIVMQNRPSLTKGDKEELDAQGFKMRTRYSNANDENESEVYVWLEQVDAHVSAEPPAPDLVTMPGVNEAVEDVIGAMPAPPELS